MGLLYRSARDRVMDDVAVRQVAVVHDASLALTHYLAWVQRDAVFLGQWGRHIVPLPAQGTDWRVFEQAFVDLMSTRSDVYAQARYIDESGMEVVRVDSTPDGVRVIPADQLQDKSDRYYFQRAMTLPAGAVSLSRFDLNMEHGKIEMPYNPMVRFSARVMDAGAQARGIVVLNVRAQPLIEQIKALTVPMGSELWLLNRQGGWMIGPRPQDEWRFMDPGAQNARLGDQRPDLWSAIQSSGEKETLIPGIANGLLSASVFNPPQRMRVPGIDLRADEDMRWYVASWLPLAALPPYLQPLRQRVTIATVSLAAVFLVVTAFWALLMVRRRQAQDAQASSEAQYHQLLESAPDAIVVTDVTGTMLYANQQAQQMFGYGANELLGQKVDQLIPPRYRDTHHGHIGRYAFAMEGRHEMGHGRELSGLRRGGSEFPAVIVLNKIDGPQGPLVIAAIQDVSEIREMQAAMMVTNQQLKAINKDLESFSYSVAHDLRSPLRVLNGFTQILLSEYGARLDAEGRHHLQRMVLASEHMSGIINGMLELSRVTRSIPVVDELDISALAQQVIDLLRAGEPGREVDVRIEPGMTAQGDPGLIMIVLQNLLGNAWKFTARTPGARIEVGTQWQDGRREYFVRDNGAGFDALRATKLFEAFERFHKASDFPGTGIGLATVARAITKHGGHIRAEAAVGQGAGFYFSLGEQPGA